MWERVCVCMCVCSGGHMCESVDVRTWIWKAVLVGWEFEPTAACVYFRSCVFVCVGVRTCLLYFACARGYVCTCRVCVHSWWLQNIPPSRKGWGGWIVLVGVTNNRWPTGAEQHCNALQHYAARCNSLQFKHETTPGVRLPPMQRRIGMCVCVCVHVCVSLRVYATVRLSLLCRGRDQMRRSQNNRHFFAASPYLFCFWLWNGLRVRERTCMRAYLHAYILAYIHTNTHTNKHTYLHTYICTHTYIPTHTYIHIHIYLHMHTSSYIYTYMYVCVHQCFDTSMLWHINALTHQCFDTSMLWHINALTHQCFDS